jgi:aromatic ring-opening dioxygenase LigB subunit
MSHAAKISFSIPRIVGGCFFFKWGQKLCPNQFIKKKRIAQFINGKLGKNQYNKTTNNTQRLTNKKTHKLAQHTTTTN